MRDRGGKMKYIYDNDFQLTNFKEFQMAGDIYYQLLSENKSYRITIDSEYILVSELKRRICNELGNSPINVQNLKQEVAKDEIAKRMEKCWHMSYILIIIIIFGSPSHKQLNFLLLLIH